MKKPIIVITHERSGTHLLINLINYDKNGDFLTIGYMNPTEKFILDNYKHQTYKDIIVNTYLENSVSKSHHQVEFILPYMDFLFDKYNVIYLKRDIKDVLVSYHRFLNADNELNPIPNFPTLKEWIFSNPKEIGYKFFADYPDPHVIIEPNNYIERWKLHTEGWLKYKDNILVLNYEDLLSDFNNQKLIIENYIGKKIGNSIPDINCKKLPNFNPGKGISGGFVNFMNDELILKINNYL
jgi:hypothetical protein